MVFAAVKEGGIIDESRIIKIGIYKLVCNYCGLAVGVMDGIYISTVRLGYSRTLPIGPFFLYFLDEHPTW